MFEYNRALLVQILIYHRPNENSSCCCGWGELGRSWAEHVANMYEIALRGQPL